MKCRPAVSLLTAFSFLMSVCAPAAHAAFEEVRKGRLFKHAQGGFLVPVSAGRITESAFRKSDTAVVVIQDLHCHPEVQKHISSILASIDRKYPVEKVFVEGNIGPQDLTWASAVRSEDLRRAALESLLEAGKLTGPEYFAVTSGRPGLLTGIEDEQPYLDNLVRLNDLQDEQRRIEPAVAGIRNDIKLLRSRYLSRKNRKVESILRKHTGNTLKKFRLLRELARSNAIDALHFRAIDEYVRFSTEQQDLRYPRVARELQNLLARLRTRLPYSEYRALTDSLLPDNDEFHLRLSLLAETDPGLLAPFPELAAFLESRRFNRRLNPALFPEEERRLVRLLHERLSESRAEREIAFLSDYFRCWEEYLHRRISAREYAYLAGNRPLFERLWHKYAGREVPADIERYSRIAESFYRTNLERNRFFLKNMLGDDRSRDAAAPVTVHAADPAAEAGRALEGARKIVVVVLGGFHTEGVIDLLAARNVSYAVITPNVTKDAAFSEQVYRDLAASQASILGATLKVLTNWQHLSFAASPEQYCRSIASVVDGAFLDGVLKNCTPDDAERLISEMLSGVCRQYGRADLSGELQFRFEPAHDSGRAGVYRYVLRLGQDEFRYQTDNTHVAAEGYSRLASRDDSPARTGKGVIPALKSVVMDFGRIRSPGNALLSRPLLRKALALAGVKNPDDLYDNFVAPVIEELIFTGIPLMLPAYTVPALIISRVLFTVLHLRVQRSDGSAVWLKPSRELLIAPLFISGLILTVCTTLPSAIFTHVISNAILVPPLRKLGLRVAKAVLGRSADTAPVEQLIIVYYSARRRLIDAVIDRDSTAYSDSYRELIESAGKVRQAASSDAIDERGVESLIEELSNAGALKGLEIVDPSGRAFLGPRDEILNAGGEVFTEDHVRWIAAAVDAVIEAFPAEQQEAVRTLRERIIERIAPYSAAALLPSPDSMSQLFAGVETPGDLLNLTVFFLNCLTSAAEFKFGFTVHAVADPMIVMHAIEDERWFKAILMHEIGHYLSRMGVIDIPQLEVMTHAVSSIMLDGEDYAALFESGERLARERTSDLSSDKLARGTLDAIAGHWQELGFPSLQAALALPERMINGSFNVEDFQRLMGAFLGGFMYGSRRDNDGELTRRNALAATFRWTDTVLARDTDDAARFAPDPQRRERLLAGIRNTLEVLTGKTDLLLVEQRTSAGRNSGKRSVFSMSEDGSVIYYVPELLDHPDDAVAQALFYEQVFLLLHSRAGWVEPHLRTSLFMTLFTALELARTRRKGIASHGGLKQSFEKLDESLYPNVHSESAKRRMASLPPFLQFIEAALYEGRTGRRDPRVADEHARQALDATRRARRRTVAAAETREAYRIVRDELWNAPDLQALIARDAEETAKMSLAQEAARRGPGPEHTQRELEELGGHLWERMNDADRDEALERSRRQIREQLDDLIEGMGRSSSRVRETGSLSEGERRGETIEALERRLASAERRSGQVKEGLERMKDIIDSAREESGGIERATGEIRGKTGASGISDEDIASLEHLMDEINLRARELEGETASLSDDTGALERDTRGMDERAAPSARGLKESAGRLHDRARRLAAESGALNDATDNIKDMVRRLSGIAGRGNTTAERSEAARIHEGSEELSRHLDQAARQAGEADDLLNEVRDHLTGAGREAAEERRRLRSGSGAEGSGQDRGADLLNEAGNLTAEAARRLASPEEGEGAPDAPSGRERALQLLEKARERIDAAEGEVPGNIEPLSRAKHGLDDAVKKLAQADASSAHEGKDGSPQSLPGDLDNALRELEAAQAMLDNGSHQERPSDSPQERAEPGGAGTQSQPPISSAAQEIMSRLLQQQDRQTGSERKSSDKIIDLSGAITGDRPDSGELRKMGNLLNPLRAEAETLRIEIRKSLQETMLGREMSGLFSGRLDVRHLDTYQRGDSFSRDLLPGRVLHRIMLVVDNSGSMGKAGDPDSAMYHAARFALIMLMALKGIDGVDVGLMMYGDQPNKQLFKLRPARELTDLAIYRMYERLTSGSGSTEDINTLEKVAEVITEAAAPEALLTVMHAGDGNPDDRQLRRKVLKLYAKTAGKNIKWASWGLGPKRSGSDPEKMLRDFEPDDEVRRLIPQALWPISGWCKDARRFSSEVAPEFIRKVFKEHRPVIALGEGVLKAVSLAFSLSVPNAEFIRAAGLRLLGLAPDETPSPGALAGLIRSSAGIAGSLLALLMRGENDVFLLSEQESQGRYAQLFKDVPPEVSLRISRAPPELMIHGRDCYVLATHSGFYAGGKKEIVIHELLADALIKKTSPGVTLAEVILHETEEAAFVEAVHAASAENDASALRKRYPLLTERESAYLLRRPASAYASFHAMTVQKYRALFSLAREIAGRRKGVTQLGYAEQGGKTFFRLKTAGMFTPVEIEVSPRSGGRRVKIFAKRNGEWTRLEPGPDAGSIPDEIAFSITQQGVEKLIEFKFNEDNLAALAEMLKIYANPNRKNGNIGLIGPRGSGKNTLGYVMLGLLGVPVRLMSLHAHITQDDLRKRNIIVSAIKKVRMFVKGIPGEVNFEIPTSSVEVLLSEAYEAARLGEAVIIDEADKVLLPGHLSGLNSLLARINEKLDGMEAIHPDFRVLVFTNSHEGGDVQGQDLTVSAADFIDRANWLWVNYMSPASELDYVMDTVFADVEDEAQRELFRAAMGAVIGVANEIRTAVLQNKISRNLSTRGVIRIARHLKGYPNDVRHFRSVFEKAFCTETLTQGRETVEEILDRSGLPNSRFPADLDLGEFRYSILNGAVYCSLGKDEWEVTVRTGHRPRDIPSAMRMLRTHWHIPANMSRFWQWMKDISQGNNIMVLGVPGTGKTEFTQYLLGDVLALSPKYQVLTSDTRGDDIFGKWKLEEGLLTFERSNMPVAMGEGAPCIVDEVDKPRDGTALSSTNNIGQFGQVHLPDGSVVDARDGFFAVYLGNLADRGGTSSQRISGEVMDRCSMYVEEPLPYDQLVEILKRYARNQDYTLGMPGDDFIEQLAAFHVKLCAAGNRLPRQPTMRALEKTLDSVGLFPDGYYDIAGTYLKGFLLESRWHQDVVRETCKSSGLPKAAQRSWVQKGALLYGTPIDHVFADRILALRDAVNGLYEQKKLPHALGKADCSNVIRSIAEQGGRLVWEEGYDFKGKRASVRSIAEVVVDELCGLEPGHVELVRGACEIVFPEIKLKFVVEQLLRQAQEHVSEAGRLDKSAATPNAASVAARHAVAVEEASRRVLLIEEISRKTDLLPADAEQARRLLKEAKAFSDEAAKLRTEAEALAVAALSEGMQIDSWEDILTLLIEALGNAGIDWRALAELVLKNIDGSPSHRDGEGPVFDASQAVLLAREGDEIDGLPGIAWEGLSHKSLPAFAPGSREAVLNVSSLLGRQLLLSTEFDRDAGRLRSRPGADDISVVLKSPAENPDNLSSNPVFSPDGRALIYVADLGKQICSIPCDPVDASFGSPATLVEQSGNIVDEDGNGIGTWGNLRATPVFTRDGRIMIIYDQIGPGNGRIVFVDRDPATGKLGAGRFRILNGNPIPGLTGKAWKILAPPSISPNGNELCVLTELDGVPTAVTLEIDHDQKDIRNARILLKEGDTKLSGFAWRLKEAPLFSPDGGMLVLIELDQRKHLLEVARDPATGYASRSSWLIESGTPLGDTGETWDIVDIGQPVIDNKPALVVLNSKSIALLPSIRPAHTAIEDLVREALALLGHDAGTPKPQPHDVAARTLEDTIPGDDRGREPTVTLFKIDDPIIGMAGRTWGRIIGVSSLPDSNDLIVHHIPQAGVEALVLVKRAAGNIDPGGAFLLSEVDLNSPNQTAPWMPGRDMAIAEAPQPLYGGRKLLVRVLDYGISKVLLAEHSVLKGIESAITVITDGTPIPGMPGKKWKLRGTPAVLHSADPVAAADADASAAQSRLYVVTDTGDRKELLVLPFDPQKGELGEARTILADNWAGTGLGSSNYSIERGPWLSDQGRELLVIVRTDDGKRRLISLPRGADRTPGRTLMVQGRKIPGTGVIWNGMTLPGVSFDGRELFVIPDTDGTSVLSLDRSAIPSSRLAGFARRLLSKILPRKRTAAPSEPAEEAQPALPVPDNTISQQLHAFWSLLLDTLDQSDALSKGSSEPTDLETEEARALIRNGDPIPGMPGRVWTGIKEFSIAPDGRELLVFAGGAVYGVDYDPAGGTLGNASVLIENGRPIEPGSDRVWDVRNVPSFSQDGRSLFVRVYLDGEFEILTIDRDPDTQVLGNVSRTFPGSIRNLPDSSNKISGPPLIPEGGRTAIVRIWLGHRYGLYVIPFDPAAGEYGEAQPLIGDDELIAGFPGSQWNALRPPLLSVDGERILAPVMMHDDQRGGTHWLLSIDWKKPSGAPGRVRVLAEDGKPIQGIPGWTWDMSGPPVNWSTSGGPALSSDGRELLVRTFTEDAHRILSVGLDGSPERLGDAAALLTNGDVVPGTEDTKWDVERPPLFVPGTRDVLALSGADLMLVRRTQRMIPASPGAAGRALQPGLAIIVRLLRTFITPELLARAIQSLSAAQGGQETSSPRGIEGATISPLMKKGERIKGIAGGTWEVIRTPLIHPSGQALIVNNASGPRGQHMLCVPWDARTNELGDAHLVAENVQGWAPHIPREGRELLFIPELGGASVLSLPEYLNRDAPGDALQIIKKGDAIPGLPDKTWSILGLPRISPDGKEMYVFCVDGKHMPESNSYIVSVRRDSAGDAWARGRVLIAEGHQIPGMPLTPWKLFSCLPSISPDGREAVLLTRMNDKPTVISLERDPDTGELSNGRILLQAGSTDAGLPAAFSTFEWPPACSEDGREVLFLAGIGGIKRLVSFERDPATRVLRNARILLTDGTDIPGHASEKWSIGHTSHISVSGNTVLIKSGDYVYAIQRTPGREPPPAPESALTELLRHLSALTSKPAAPTPERGVSVTRDLAAAAFQTLISEDKPMPGMPAGSRWQDLEIVESPSLAPDGTSALVSVRKWNGTGNRLLFVRWDPKTGELIHVRDLLGDLAPVPGHTGVRWQAGRTPLFLPGGREILMQVSTTDGAVKEILSLPFDPATGDIDTGKFVFRDGTAMPGMPAENWEIAGQPSVSPDGRLLLVWIRVGGINALFALKRDPGSGELVSAHPLLEAGDPLPDLEREITSWASTFNAIVTSHGSELLFLLYDTSSDAITQKLVSFLFDAETLRLSDGRVIADWNTRGTPSATPDGRTLLVEQFMGRSAMLIHRQTQEDHGIAQTRSLTGAAVRELIKDGSPMPGPLPGDGTIHPWRVVGVPTLSPDGDEVLIIAQVNGSHRVLSAMRDPAANTLDELNDITSAIVPDDARLVLVPIQSHGNKLLVQVETDEGRKLITMPSDPVVAQIVGPMTILAEGQKIPDFNHNGWKLDGGHAMTADGRTLLVIVRRKEGLRHLLAIKRDPQTRLLLSSRTLTAEGAAIPGLPSDTDAGIRRIWDRIQGPALSPDGSEVLLLNYNSGSPVVFSLRLDPETGTLSDAQPIIRHKAPMPGTASGTWDLVDCSNPSCAGTELLVQSIMDDNTPRILSVERKGAPRAAGTGAESASWPGLLEQTLGLIARSLGGIMLDAAASREPPDQAPWDPARVTVTTLINDGETIDGLPGNTWKIHESPAVPAKARELIAVVDVDPDDRRIVSFKRDETTGRITRAVTLFSSGRMLPGVSSGFFMVRGKPSITADGREILIDGVFNNDDKSTKFVYSLAYDPETSTLSDARLVMERGKPHAGVPSEAWWYTGTEISHDGRELCMQIFNGGATGVTKMMRADWDRSSGSLGEFREVFEVGTPVPGRPDLKWVPDMKPLMIEGKRMLGAGTVSGDDIHILSLARDPVTGALGDTKELLSNRTPLACLGNKPLVFKAMFDTAGDGTELFLKSGGEVVVVSCPVPAAAASNEWLLSLLHVLGAALGDTVHDAITAAPARRPPLTTAGTPAGTAPGSPGVDRTLTNASVSTLLENGNPLPWDPDDIWNVTDVPVPAEDGKLWMLFSADDRKRVVSLDYEAQTGGLSRPQPVPGLVEKETIPGTDKQVDFANTCPSTSRDRRHILLDSGPWAFLLNGMGEFICTPIAAQSILPGASDRWLVILESASLTPEGNEVIVLGKVRNQTTRMERHAIFSLRIDPHDGRIGNAKILVSVEDDVPGFPPGEKMSFFGTPRVTANGREILVGAEHRGKRHLLSLAYDPDTREVADGLLILSEDQDIPGMPGAKWHNMRNFSATPDGKTIFVRQGAKILAVHRQTLIAAPPVDPAKPGPLTTTVFSPAGDATGVQHYAPAVGDALAVSDPRSFLRGTPLERLMQPVHADPRTARRVPMLEGKGAILYGYERLEEQMDPFSRAGARCIGVERLIGPADGLARVTLKTSDGQGTVTGSVYAPVNGKNVELTVFRRPGERCVLAYDADLSAYDLTASEEKLFLVLAPIAVGRWAADNPHAAKLLGLPGFTFDLVRTGETSALDPDVLALLAGMRDTLAGQGLDEALWMYSAANRDDRRESGADVLASLRRHFDFVAGEASDAAQEVRVAGELMKDELPAPACLDNPALAGITFENIEALRHRAGSYAQEVDAYIIRHLPKKLAGIDLRMLRRAVAGAGGKRVVSHYRLARGESLGEAERSIAQRSGLGTSVILDLREFAEDDLDPLAGWVRTLVRNHPYAITGIRLAPDTEFSDASLYETHRLQKVVPVSFLELLDPDGFSALTTALERERRNTGARIWIDMDYGDGVPGNDATLTISDIERARAGLAENYGRLMGFARTFSLPDDLVVACEGELDIDGPGSLLLAGLRNILERELGQDPAYRFGKGRARARKRIVHDRAGAQELAGDARFLRDTLDFLLVYRSGKNPESVALAGRLAPLHGADRDFAAGYLFGTLESAAGTFIDENRPFLERMHAELFARTVVELQLTMHAQGVSVETLMSYEDLAGAARETSRSWSATGRQTISAMDSAGRIRRLQDTATAAVVQETLRETLYEQWTAIRDDSSPEPAALVILLELLALAEREEKGLLDQLERSAGTLILPEVVKAVLGAS